MIRVVTELIRRMLASLKREGQKADVAECGMCGRPLNVPADPLSGDCGGDCWGCIGIIEAAGDDDAEHNLSIGLTAKEIDWGWREADGTPKPQAFFIENPQIGRRPAGQ